jgi:hypothetical protein
MAVKLVLRAGGKSRMSPEDRARMRAMWKQYHEVEAAIVARKKGSVIERKSRRKAA